MKLRYQMRGLGIGMIVTALLMGVATGKGIPLSDAEIRAKALELGMVESDSVKLTDIRGTAQNPENNKEPDGEPGTGESGAEKEPDGTAGQENTEPDPSESVSGNTESDSSESAPESAEPDSSESAPENTEPHSAESDPDAASDMITIVIEPGTTSYRICLLLEEKGLVEDADAFDTWLCDQGYSRKIDSGTYEIPADASEEEIVKIITKNR